MKHTIDLVRHGKSKWMEEAEKSPVKRFGGRMNDDDLCPTGETQAIDLGVYANKNNIRPTRFVVSPALRAVRSYKLSRPGIGGGSIPVSIAPGLQELSWGNWERQPRSVADLWSVVRRSKGFDFRPPGHGAESFNMVEERALEELRKVVANTPDGSHIWAYTHRNVIKSLVRRQLCWTPDEAWAAEVNVVSLTRLVFSGNRYVVKFFNRPTVVGS